MSDAGDTGASGPCGNCGAPQAPDQRYCLNCGERRGEPRLDFVSHLVAAGAGDVGTVDMGNAPTPARDTTPLVALGALALLGTMLAVGVLIGKGGGSAQVASSQPQVITVASDGAAASGGSGKTVDAAATSFKDDWPAGKDGYTVEIGTLPKAGTDAAAVDQAKSDAADKGAKDVGALDSDNYGSLPGGKYVVYSGVFSSEADANKALSGLKSKFPDAQVVHVSASSGGGGGGGASSAPAPTVDNITSGSADSAGTVTASQSALQQLNSANGDASQQALRNLPQNISTGGHAPKPDNKPPGGGSGGGIVIH